MTKKLIVLFVLVAALVFAGSNYNLKVYDSLLVNGKVLKPGEYKLTVTNNTATISQGKEKVEATVKVEETKEKFDATSVRFVPENGQNKIQEIRLGGTKTKLVFN